LDEEEPDHVEENGEGFATFYKKRFNPKEKQKKWWWMKPPLLKTQRGMTSDCQGFQNPPGFAGRVRRAT